MFLFYFLYSLDLSIINLSIINFNIQQVVGKQHGTSLGSDCTSVKC